MSLLLLLLGTQLTHFSTLPVGLSSHSGSYTVQGFLMAYARSYENAIKCLNSLQTNFSTIQEIHKQWALGKPTRDPDLIPEMIEWIRRIGYAPEDFDALHPVHITGTKGKGSVCAFVQSILLQYIKPGSKIGLYTSPHLMSVRERIMINGKPIDEDKFAKYFFDVYERLDATSSDTSRFPKLLPQVKPMYFRFLTLVSLHAFKEEKVDSAIYEVGIGGEHDSTNVFVHPSACGVTSLGIDHTAVLGNTIEEIAWNKAGIFKPGAAAFTILDQPKGALRVLEERAREKNVSSFEAVPIHPDIKGRVLGLRGKFQEKNATLACYLAAKRLGISIGHKEALPPKFIAGLEAARWPGRCETIETPKAKWFIDGAHTAESLEVAADWFSETVDKSRPITLVFNQQKRDNVEELLIGLHRALSSRGVKISKAYFTTNQSYDSGFQSDMISLNVSQEAIEKLTVQRKLAATWSEIDPKAEVKVFPSLERVVEEAEGQVFATGSLLMIGGLLTLIE